jgi:hypothetical protein
MATNSITGNIGIPDLGVVTICCSSPNGTLLFTTNKTGGDYTFTGLVPGTYTITASTRDVTSGPLVGYVYRNPKSVTFVVGSLDATGVNLNPSAPNAAGGLF